MIANLLILVMQLGRFIILARWLPVSTFGVIGFAASTIIVYATVTDFGLLGAFLNRTDEFEDEEQAYKVFFTLRGIFSLTGLIIALLVINIFASGDNLTAFSVIAFTMLANQVIGFPSMIFTRQVKQRRNAIFQMLTAVASTPVMLILAWQGYALWSLLSVYIVSTIMSVAYYYLWRPIWRPRLGWDINIARHYLQYSYRHFISNFLYQVLDRVDDIWIGLYLGQTALGFYTRAYTLATYPRQVLAKPINNVIHGTYAELKGERAQLSHTFFVSNAFLIRSGFLMAGLLAVSAPEMLPLILGEKWSQMVSTFQLMLVFTLLDPLKISISSATTFAAGRPELVALARGSQLIVLVIGLYILGDRWGIDGVAVAVNVMLIVGIGLMLRQASQYADFSLSSLFLVPFVALFMGGIISFACTLIIPELWIDLWRGIVKGIMYTFSYLGLLFLLERTMLIDMFQRVKYLIISPKSQHSRL